MSAVFKREFKSYFTNMSGALFISVLLLFTGIFVTAINLIGQYPALEYALENVIIVFLLIVPILAMRSISEDKRAKTDSLLYSLPIRLSSVVLGKYFAMLAVFLIPVAIMALYPVILSQFGKGMVNFASAYSSLFGFFMLGAALIAICMFMSSLTESQVIAAVTGFAVSLLLYFMTTISGMIPSAPLVSLVCFLLLAVLAALILYYLTKNLSISLIIGGVLVALTVLLYVLNRSLFEGGFGALLSSFALFERFYDFTYGIFNLKDVIFYLSFSAFFVFLTVRSLEKKRWA
ncbi:MAG: ABC transporter permease [Clostridia bacterium]|nr:ABC transporter permease [Clostridia bacterium]